MDLGFGYPVRESFRSGFGETMRKTLSIAALILFTSAISVFAQNAEKLDIITYTPPSGWEKEPIEHAIQFSKENPETGSFCIVVLMKPFPAGNDSKEVFASSWKTLVKESMDSSEAPTMGEAGEAKGWKIESGIAKYKSEGVEGVVMVYTFSGGGKVVNLFVLLNSDEFEKEIDAFVASIDLPAQDGPGKQPEKMSGSSKTTSVSQTKSDVTPSNSTGITKYITNFDDGWLATPTQDYVQVTRNGTEVRLFYVNKQFDDSRPNTTEPNDYYWSMAVEPYFNTSNLQKWSGVEYPVIYFMQADAVDKRTGKRCFVAMKIVFEGGGRAVVAVTPDRNTYEKQFPHPNDLNKMLSYNKFGIAAQDLIGSWTGGGGGAVEYYGVYSGTYAGLSAVSTANDFVFTSNGTYQHTYKSAKLNTGSSQFARIDYKGKFSASDWEITATNHYNGTTATFSAHLSAIRGGFLLHLADRRNNVDYTLFKKNRWQ